MDIEISGKTQERATGLTPLERAFNFKNFWQDRSPRSQDPRKYDEKSCFCNIKIYFSQEILKNEQWRS